MKKLLFTLALSVSLLIGYGQSVLVEAESFANTGGWVIDQQFIPSMGSSYLLAHGMGEAVDNASTTVTFPEKGNYHYWVRTKDWVPDHEATPGTFKLIIDGKTQKPVFGTNPMGWQWVYGGVAKIKKTEAKLELKDLTGFEGRCDAIYFSTNEKDVPPNELKAMTDWRAEKLGTKTPKSAGKFDLVIAGGGLSGCAAALTAARQGLSVALINDRPVLGGNASKEVRVHTLGIVHYSIVEEINTEHYPNGHADAIPTNDSLMQVMQSQENLSLFLNTYVNGVEKDGNKITKALAINTITSEKISFEGDYFIDATGDGWLGYYAGASYMIGRESKDEFKESMAPDTKDKMTMGNSVLWNSYDAGKPSTFPDLPWAKVVSKDYKVKAGEWFWEYGMHLSTIYDAEMIRDHVLRAIYGTWSNVKADPENANLKMKWLAYVAGKRESRRLVGEYVLKQSDIENRIPFADGFVEEVREIDIHYPKPGKYDFLSYADFTKIKKYTIPYRCFVSKDISNMFMAGRCFSGTHVGLGSPRVMHTTAQMGVVAGAGAVVCKKNECSPIDVYNLYLTELKNILEPLKIKEKKH